MTLTRAGICSIIFLRERRQVSACSLYDLCLNNIVLTSPILSFIQLAVFEVCCNNQIGRLGGVHLGNTFNVETKKYFPGYRWFHIFLYWGRCGRNSHEAPFFLGAFLIWQFNRKTTIFLNNNSSMKTNQVHIWFLIAVCSWQARFNFRKCWKASDFLIQRLSIDQDTTRDKIVMKRKASISRNIKRQFSLSFNIFYDLALCL